MKKIINISLIILVTLSFLFTVISLTLLNKNFIISRFNKYNYYDGVYKEITKEISDGSIVKISDIKADINFLAKNRFSYNIYSKVKPNSKKNAKTYLYYINFKNIFVSIDCDLIANIIYIMNILLIVVTGLIFLKTSKIHNLNFIFKWSAILSIINYFIIKVFNRINYNIFYKIVDDASKYYLAISIIMVEIIIYKKIKHKKEL